MGLMFESMCEFDGPFRFRLFETEECDTHGEDDEGCEEVERALPEVFGLRPEIADAGGVELHWEVNGGRVRPVSFNIYTVGRRATHDTDEGTTDSQSNDEARDGASPDLKP